MWDEDTSPALFGGKPLDVCHELLRSRFTQLSETQGACLDVGFMAGVQAALALVAADGEKLSQETRFRMLEGAGYVRFLGAQIESKAELLLDRRPS
jgi:hypothetical protein